MNLKMLVITIDDLAANLEKYIGLAADGKEITLLVNKKEYAGEVVGSGKSANYLESMRGDERYANQNQ